MQVDSASTTHGTVIPPSGTVAIKDPSVTIQDSTAIPDVSKATDTGSKASGSAATPDSSKVEGDDFSTFMQKALGGAGKTEVNEEELFAAIIEQRLQKENPAAAEAFRSEKSSLMVSMARADGYVPVEDVAKKALQNIVSSGKIDKEAAEKINGIAFAGAQLDSNLDALYDGRGGPDDPTIAVMKLEAAMLNARAMVDKFDSGEMTAEARALDIPSNVAPGSGGAGAIDGPTADPANAPSGEASAADGKDGFLWKPVSESNGNLVILLPSSLAGLISDVEIHSELPPTEENKIGSGKFSSNANGGRDHFRFDKPGSEYGENVYVVAHKKGGDIVTYKIEDGSKRID